MGLNAGKQGAVAVVGGVTLAAAFPPWSMPWLAPLGVAALIIAVGRTDVRDAARVGFLFGLGFFGPAMWWLSASIAPAAWAALVVLQAAWLAVFGVGATLVRRVRLWPAWVAMVWSATEEARSRLPWSGFPWGRLGHTAVDTPWEGSLSLVGVAGTSAAVALIGATVAATFETVRARRATPPTRSVARATVAIGAIAGSAATLAANLGADDVGPRPRNAKVAVLQSEVPGDGTDVAANHRQITSTLLEQTRELATSANDAEPAPDLVVWPENATAVDPATDEVAEDALLAAVKVFGAPVLAGSVTDGPSAATAFNQGIVWTSGGPQDRYTKQHLVPFGEYVPLRSVAERFSDRIGEIPRDMLPGTPQAPIRAGDLVLANALCFDVAYDDVLREQVAQGADVAVVQTSNAMFLGTAQQEQQWMVTRSRAIELGRSVVVSSINGVSGAIAPDGTVIDRLPVAQAGSTTVDVPIMTGSTLAVRLGPWPARVFGALGAVGVLMALTGTHRRGPSVRPSTADAVAASGRTSNLA
jgi:apolipoprotein N-acyltransferase